MCDCFHLAFPNWHASATGEGRRLKAPEQDTDDDLVCEEPEVLQGERPRPQGSSPVEEFPTTEKYAKTAEGEFYDSPAKSSKKGKKIGFGSLFDKRSSVKMNQTEDLQSDQSEVIVKTVKEVCAEGLVVSGGGQDGIFIKEVKPESPASKHLNAKEGDQILSATVYFDNVSYEDALQILEHAQPYKVAFCLKRKPPPRTQEDAETMRPDITIGEEAEHEEERGGPEMRGRRKTKKQHDRISWPKFPTFSKGRRAHFKRSHSTSEAEEQRKLEISPPTSDTESPLKSPLKSPDGKDKKKMHKMKLKMKMAGRRSKSVEETENEEALTTDNMEVLDNQIIMNITEEQVPVINVIESPKILNEAEKTDSTKARIDYTLPNLTVTESLNKVELISLDTTLKATDITVALEDDGKEKIERSELKVSISGKDKCEIETESLLKSSTSGMRSSDASTIDNIMDSPNIISQTEAAAHQVESDSKPIIKEIIEKLQESGETDIKIPTVAIALDMPDIGGTISKSPKLGSDKEKKERNILETESYGIRTRGPLADIATSKSHFANTVSGLEFASSDTLTFEMQTKQEVSSKVIDTKKPITSKPVVSQPKSQALEVDRSKKSTGGIDTTETKKSDVESNFKLPKVDLSKFDQGQSITIGQGDPNKAPLLKREEIEIPGMEDKKTKAKSKAKSQRSNEQKIEKIINISKAEKSRAQGEAEEFNVEDVKEAVSKFPAFKLPDRDITGVLVQREITILEMKTDKTATTPKGSPSKVSSMSTEINIKLPDTVVTNKQSISPVFSKDQAMVLPKTEVNLEETVIAERKTAQSKTKLADHKPKIGKMVEKDKISASHDVKIKLPKREDIEIPGMEAINQMEKAKDTDTQVKDYTDTDAKADRKGHEKKSKKGKVSLPSFGIMTPDIRFPGIAIELPIKAMSTKNDSDAIKDMKTEQKSYDADIGATKQSSKEATFEKPKKGESCVPEIKNKEAPDVGGDQMLHRGITTAIKVTSKQGVEGEPKAEMKSTDTDSSPHKKKLPKLKMPKIGGKSVKGITEVSTQEDVAVQENDVIEVVLDSEKRTSKTDPKGHNLDTDKTWPIKMPSIDVSVPKIKIPKTEGKSKQEETYAGVELAKDKKISESTQKPVKEKGKIEMRVDGVEDAQEESGFRLIKFGISLPKGKTEEADPLPEESEQSVIKAVGKTEVEQSELPHSEIKETDSKMKKRKISFPKFGFSKSESKASDSDVTLPPPQDGDWTEIDVGTKTTYLEAEFKESTESPTKFRLPTIKFPKFGVSLPKTTDAGADIHISDVSTEDTTVNVELPEAKLSVELTTLSENKGLDMPLSVCKPKVDLSLPEGKVGIKDISIPKVDDFQKKEVDASITDHDVEISKTDIKDDISPPQVDASIPEGSVEIKVPEVNFTILKEAAEDKNITAGGAPIKIKLPSIHLPTFGGKSSKVKDMPVVNMDVKGPDVSLPETEVNVKLKDDAPSFEVKDSFVTLKGVDMKVEEAKLKEQDVMVTLPKFGISLPKVQAHKPEDSTDKESNTDIKESKPESDQAEKGSRSPTKIKLPTIKFPKIGVSYPKSPDVDLDNQVPMVNRDEPTVEFKEPSEEIPALPELKTQHITLSVSKPEVDVSKPEEDKAADAICEKKKEKILSSDYEFSKPEVKMSLVDHDLDKKTDLEDSEMQAKQLDMKTKLPSGTVDVVIPEAKEKESEIKLKKRKISFPKFGFSKSDTKVPDADINLHGISEQEIATEVTVPAPELEVQMKNKSTSDSPSKFKLPTISLPKFDISISKMEEESTAKADEVSHEVKVASGDTLLDQDTGKQGTEPSKLTLETLPEYAEIKTKDSDPESQGSKFTMPKFEFSFPKLKGPEFKKSASKIDTEKTEATLKPYKEIAEGETEIPEASVEFEVTSASVQAAELDVNVDSDLKMHTTEMSKDDTTTGGSPIKFKLPSFKLPKFGISSSKGKPEITDLKGEETTLKAKEIEASDLKMDFGQELKKSSSSVQQPKVLTKVQTSKAEGDISLPEGELWEPSAEVEVPKVKLECKIDQEADIKDTGINLKRPGFSLPKFGFSKPDTKVPEIDVNLMQVDFSKSKGDVKINEQSMNITAPSVEQKDSTIDATTKDTIPSMNLPAFGGPSIKMENIMPVAGISVKGPEVSAPGAQISVDLKVKDAELGGQEGKMPKMPKLGIALPKVKGFDLSTKTEDVVEVQPIDVKQPDMTIEGKVHPPEYDSKTLDVQMKTLPGFGFSKPEVKTPEVKVSTQKTDILIPEGSIDPGEANVDINVSKVECEQKGSTFFGSPTKFKLPSISLPKFGVKSQKVALDTNLTESELEGANIKHDISKPDVKLEVKPPSIEAKVESSTDTPDVDSKGPQVKVKRPSFSFPKFGFSKSDTATPEADVSVHKVEVSIPDTTVPIKEQTAEITLPGGEAEQKDLTTVISPTKFTLPDVNLPKFGVKTSKGTVSLPSPNKGIIEITTQQSDIKVAGQIVKMEKEADVNITPREADVLPKEEKIILPQLDVDTQDLSIEGKADIPEVDLRGLDVKLKKPSFSFPKFGFSKPDKGQSVDASLTKTEMSIKEGDIPVKEKDVELAVTCEENKQEDPNTQTKFRLPSINLPKFSLKYPKATPEISTAEVDIKKTELSFTETGEVQITDTEVNIDIKGPTTDVESKDIEVDIDVTGSKPKVPKIGISMPKVKEMEQESKDINIKTDRLCKEKVNVQQHIEGKLDKAEVDSEGLKVKLPKLGFSKPDLKTPEIDVRLPKADMSISVGYVDVSELSADIKLPEQEPDLKEDTSGSSTRFKLPTVNLPKFGIKASKDTVDISTADIDTKSPEVSLPDKKFMSGQVSTIDMKGLTVGDPSIETEIKGDKKEQQDGKFKIPKFGIALPTIKDPDSEVHKKTLNDTEGTVSADVLSTDKKDLKLPKGSAEVDIKAKGVELEVEKSKFKLPQLGISHELKGPEIDISVSKAEVPQTEVKVKPAEAEMDFSSKGLKTKKPGFGLPKIGFSKSDGKAQDIQASEMTADITLPEGTIEIGESEIEGKAEITSPQFGSPTKFKLPTIKLPKFGISTPKVTSDAPKRDSDIKDLKVSSVDNKIETTNVDISGDIKGKTAEIEASSVSINIKEKEINQEVLETKFQIPKFGISLPKVKGPEVTVTAKKVKTGTPETGITEPEIEIPGDVSVPKVDAVLEGSSSLEKKEIEMEMKSDSAVSGSPSRFKLPAFKMPKFGISVPKTSDAKAKVEADVPDNADLNIENKPIQVSTDINREGEIKETSEQPPEAAVKKSDGEKGSPSKFKLPSIKMPKISISRTKSQDEDDTTIKATPEAKTEPKGDPQAPGKSPRFAMPALEDVLRGFEVEFNVPTIEQTDAQLDKPSVKQDQEEGDKSVEAAEQKEKAQEKSKFKFKFPKLGFSQSSDESDKLVDAKIEESEKHLEALADVKEAKTAVSKDQAKTEKGGWFKFSFSSPTKTTKPEEKEEITQQTEQAEKPDDVEKESSKPQEENEKSSLSEAVEEIISPTLSLRSSEAFADVSSTVTTDQIALSQTSPTKVKVKYAEPTATVGINDVQSDVVTSTARCELISMEPHQPEKVNIPFSSDMSSTSVDTQKQMSGEIHVITSNIQAVPDTQQAAILTNIDGRGIHTSPLQVTLGSDSVLTVEETRVQSGMRTTVERHVVQETLHDDKETILVTQRTRIFEGDSAEPISDETASSIRRLRDTVHTEKMRFFDSVATTEEVTIVSSETTLRHMDSSTDENGGK
ncbi:LOW QUALITY PROTEIN: neuroblast differentiation-associated protein AHNAK-like [Danio aesculapii]|uniref:LOW QUALITY PROTEIN: neuroblast differentiation-associated protein AHNAK-like n=1 Tax=Danio aesculapii TaxID=1142201 RepID=UPI0024BF5336|nr:LOW QUALITY PROTEIN: neuroblast differentiation-associated protein AHNAK-like [Danio aesculapii]